MSSLELTTGGLREGAPAREAAINDRYEILRLLGRGGMGDVYLVADAREAGRLLALKSIRKDRMDERTLAILRNEFLSLSALPHPNLARVYEFGVDRETGDYYFTSEFVDGLNWLKAVQPLDLGSKEHLEEFLHVLAQVLRALEFIHCRGLVHGDIKPENILVRREVVQGGEDPATALGAKIIDFGLAKKEKAFGGKKILGTPYYVAPETILGSAIDRKADLYSLGVVLYHLTAGTPPFVGNSNLMILKGHIEGKAVSPAERNPRLPAALAAMILKLMEKKPADRMQSALEVIDEINRAFGLALPFETPETRASYLEAALVVGREREVAKLRSIFLAAAGKAPGACEPDESVPPVLEAAAALLAVPAEEAPAPPGRMVLLRGERGLGKRKVIEELRFVVQAQGARFLAFECGGSTGADGEVARFAEELSTLHGGQLGSLLEALKKPPGPPPRKAPRRGDAALDARRALFRETALAILKSSLKQPLVLHLHEIHMAGRELLDLVRNLVQFAAQEKVPEIRFLATATTLDASDIEKTEFQELSDSIPFRNHVFELKVDRLDERAVERLVHSAFAGSNLPAAFTARVFEESDGNLDTLIEILRFFLDREKIVRTPSGWALSPDYDREDVPGKVRSELQERIARLPPEALRLAIGFSCMGEACDLELAADLAGVSARSAARQVERLKRDKILQARAQGNRGDLYTFVHSSARTFIYRLIPEADLPGMHGRAGALIEERARAQGKDNARALAHHYLRAGDRLKGTQYGLEAARGATSELDPLEALRIYEQVLALGAASDADLGRSVRGSIAVLRFQIGDYRGVLEALGRLPPVAGVKGDPRWEFGAYLQAGRARIRLGHFDEAASLLDGALTLARRLPASGAETSVLFAFAELHFLKGEIVESLRYTDRLLAMRGEMKDVLLTSEAYMLLADNQSLLNDRERAASHCQNALRLIDAQHDTRLLAWSLFCRGKLYLFKGQYAKALKQFQLSLILRRKMHAGDGQADCLLEIASIHHALGAPEEALPGLEEALVLYEKTGNLPRWVAARSLQGEVLRLVGDYPRCYQAVADALRRLGTFDSRRVTVRTLLTFAGLCVDKGDLAHAERYLRDAQAHESRGYGTSAATVKTLALLAEHAWHGGRLGAAIECATQGLTAAREIGDPALLAQVLILQAFLLRRLGKGGEARRAFVNALDLAARHELSSIEGWAKVVEGMVLRDEGKFEAAERFFAEAGEILGTHGSERDLAALHLEHGLLYLERGELEEAYLKFEEGLELAKKLHLRFMEARFHLAIGLLDMELGEGEEKRAEENLRHAEDIAAPAPYTEILWRARYQLGSLFLRRGLMVKGEAKLRESFASLKDVLGSIPAPYRESYLRASGAEGLASLLERTLRLGAPGIEATGRACGPGAPVTGDEGDRGAEAEGSVDLPRHEPRAIVV